MVELLLDSDKDKCHKWKRRDRIKIARTEANAVLKGRGGAEVIGLTVAKTHSKTNKEPFTWRLATFLIGILRLRLNLVLRAFPSKNGILPPHPFF